MQLVLSQSRWLRFGSFSAFYFAQGVPIGLLSIAIPAWLAEQGSTLGEIGAYLGWIGLPWALKLIAGPFMDRFTFLPMGFRRPWVIALQGGLVLSLVAVAFVGAGYEVGDPLMALTVAGVVVNIFAATQDVAVDGMAIDVLPEDERGRANAFMGFGQVAASSAFGALCGTLLAMAGITAGAIACAATVALIFMLAAVLRERPGERLLPWTAGKASPRRATHSLLANLKDVAIVLAMPMSLLAISVEFVARLRDGMALGLFPVLATQDLGFTGEQFTWFNGIVGFVAAALVILLGPAIDRFGAKRLLLIALFGSVACHVVAFGLPGLWDQPSAVAALFCVSTLLSQLVFVGVIALFMNLCSQNVAATQFAVYMALANLGRSAGGWSLPLIEDHLGSIEILLLMGLLVLAAAAILLFLDTDRHKARLSRLEQQSLALGTVPRP